MGRRGAQRRINENNRSRKAREKREAREARRAARQAAKEGGQQSTDDDIATPAELADLGLGPVTEDEEQADEVA